HCGPGHTRSTTRPSIRRWLRVPRRLARGYRTSRDTASWGTRRLARRLSVAGNALDREGNSHGDTPGAPGQLAAVPGPGDPRSLLARPRAAGTSRPLGRWDDLRLRARGVGTCTSTYYAVFQGHSWKEIGLLTQELNQQRRRGEERGACRH